MSQSSKNRRFVPWNLTWSDDMDSRLRELWPNENLSLNQLGTEFKVSASSIKRRAMRLGLPVRTTQYTEFWDEETTNLLKEMWSQGHSGKQIGNVLGTTRSAVIAKKTRLRLPERPQDRSIARHNAAIRPKLPYQRPMIRLPKLPVAPVPEVKEDKPGITILELNSTTCRAVIGTGADGLARYCGDKTEGSFCDGHHAKYYIPGSTRSY